MSLAQGQIYAKDMTFYVPIVCIRFARYCGKIYSCHLFPYGGLNLQLLHRVPA